MTTTRFVTTSSLLRRQSMTRIFSPQVIHSWEPAVFFSALMDRGLNDSLMKNPFNGQQESIWEIVGFGLTLTDNTTPGSKLPVKQIKTSVQRRLAQMLDPPDSHGRDWCLLAVRLGLGDRVAQLDSATDSPTLRFVKTNRLFDIGYFLNSIIIQVAEIRGNRLHRWIVGETA